MVILRCFTTFEWNEKRKNPDVIETFRDFVCVLVAEGGIIRGEIYHSMLSKQYGFDITL